MRTSIWVMLLLWSRLAAVHAVAEPEKTAPPVRGAAAEDPDLRSEIRRLRQEVERLSAKVEQLDRSMGHSAAPRSPDSGVPSNQGRSGLDAGPVLAQYSKGKAEIRKAAREKVRHFRMRVTGALREIQDRYTREARLDEAVAIRDCIRGLMEGGPKALPDPGTVHVDEGSPRVAFYRVTGAHTGSVWGTGVYTSDSSLATAAVHAGVLKLGQTGVVKVTAIVNHPSFDGSMRNGIQSSAYGTYAGFLVEPARADDEDDAEDEMLALRTPAVAVPAPEAPAGGGPFLPALRIPFRVHPGAAAAPTAPPLELPPDAGLLLEQFEDERASIWKNANQELSKLRQQAIAGLKPVQDACTREGKLDEAVAIRDRIRALQEGELKPLPDPGTLNRQNLRTGEVLYFRVTGHTRGIVWGTDVYTVDSVLASSAVHAGVLREGQTGVVKVTGLPGRSEYEGTHRHGVTSRSQGGHAVSYGVASAADEGAVGPGAQPRPAPPAPAGRPAPASPAAERPDAQPSVPPQ